MSLDKAILHKKEHRKKYYGAKAVDKYCRNHGNCTYCKQNRQYSTLKRKQSADSKSDTFQWKRKDGVNALSDKPKNRIYCWNEHY